MLVNEEISQVVGWNKLIQRFLGDFENLYTTYREYTSAMGHQTGQLYFS